MKIPPFTGKTLHETLFDPRLFRLQVKEQVNLAAKQEFAGQSPNLFVGRFGYPQVRVGLLTTEQYDRHDDPLSWAKEKASIQDVIRRRSELVNAGSLAHVKLPSPRLAQKVKELAGETAMAIRPVDVEVGLDRPPLFRLELEDDAMPHGPRADLVRAQLTSNPRIPAFVQKVVDDKDLRAGEGLGRLWRHGFSEHHLTKLLTAGTLGEGLERRLVPTRWGITAVDDIIGKQLQAQLRDFPEADIEAYLGGHLGNYFLVLFFPQPWTFELFENVVGALPERRSIVDEDERPALRQLRPLQTSYTDFEGIRGRTTYAEHTAGGYYAARIAVLEKLVSMKRQAGVLVIRLISDEYWAPLGVWVVREAVRNALAAQPLRFGSEDLALRYASAAVQRRFGADLAPVLAASKLLATRRSQTTLAQFS